MQPIGETAVFGIKKMKLIVQLLLLSMLLISSKAQEKTKIYLIPGQGSDERIFSKLTFPESYELVHIDYLIPHESETLKEYAERLSGQIEEEDHFVLVGVSLGGMIATEIAEFKNPEQVIIISSAKNSEELPDRYTLQQELPFYKLVGPKLSKSGAKVLQTIVEPDSKNEKELFQSMLDEKDPVFLKRTIEMIINWEKTTYSEDIIHIHGNKDRTLPIRNVKYTHLIEEGSHMMTLTQPDEISQLLTEILGQ